MTKAPRKTTFRPGRGYSRSDWEDVSANPEWSAEDLAGAKPFAEAFPALAESIKRSRGRPRAEEPKAAVTLRLAPSTLARFQAASPDWRKRMAAILDKAKV